MTKWSDSTYLQELMTRYPEDRDIIVIDTETTGLSTHDYEKRRYNYVLQASIIDAKTETTLFDRYFKPRIKSWPDAERVNHISPEMVRDCKSITHSAHELREIIYSAKVIIGYNTSFDLAFLKASNIKPNDDVILIDVMEDYAVWYGAFNEYFGSYTWQKLVNATRETGYDWSSHADAHNSLGDCYATLDVAKYLQKKYDEGWKPEWPQGYYLDDREEYDHKKTE